MNIAVAGAGRIGEVHVRNLLALAGVSGVAIADVDGTRAREVAARTGATAAADVTEALDRADALVVATNSDSHAALVRLGIARRVPVFCEKPLALELRDASALAEEIDRAGIPFQLGFHRRSDPAYVRLREMVRRGELGTIYLATLLSYDPSPPSEDYVARSGGIFRDKCVHDFDLARWLTGHEVVEVQAAGTVREFDFIARHDDHDTVAMILRMDDGLLATVVAARNDARGYDVRTELIGSRDAVAVGLGARTPIRSLDDGSAFAPADAWKSNTARFGEAYRREMETFLSVATGSAPSPCLAHDGVEALRIAVAAERSARERRSVVLETRASTGTCRWS